MEIAVARFLSYSIMYTILLVSNSSFPSLIGGETDMSTVEEKIAIRASRKLSAERTVLAKGKFAMESCRDASKGQFRQERE